MRATSLTDRLSEGGPSRRGDGWWELSPSPLDTWWGLAHAAPVPVCRAGDHVFKRGETKSAEAADEQALAVLDDARDRMDAGAPLFFCALVVSEVQGHLLTSKARPKPRQFGPAAVLAAVESLGWRLEHVDHVWVQTAAATNAGLGGIGGMGFSGIVQGNYVFRNPTASASSSSTAPLGL